jgi:cell wall-associated NlpC family hydrolase
MLCTNGAANGANLQAGVFAYNHPDTYATEVIALANSYGQTQAQTVAAGTVGGIAVDWALAQVGTPYIWGGESPGVGFDCSGLVQAAYEVAGITLSRVAQDQFDAGPQLPAGTPLEPGDLVFFGGGPGDVSHVGPYADMENGRTVMVEAPGPKCDRRLELPFSFEVAA